MQSRVAQGLHCCFVLQGNVNIAELKAKAEEHAKNLAAFMITWVECRGTQIKASRWQRPKTMIVKLFTSPLWVVAAVMVAVLCLSFDCL